MPADFHDEIVAKNQLERVCKQAVRKAYGNVLKYRVTLTQDLTVPSFYAIIYYNVIIQSHNLQ